MLISNIILIINGRGTLKPLGIQFRSFANGVRDMKYHKWCSEEGKVTSQDGNPFSIEVPLTFLH
jgi:hypothetical protein